MKIQGFTVPTVKLQLRMFHLDIPFIKPNPPRLSQLSQDLLSIEQSGVFTNYGPVNARFETAATEVLFGGVGHCLTVCNATIGLMLAIQDAIETAGTTGRRFALMPSFTFAATAHAAMWCGLTPIFCDIDPATWLPSEDDELNLLQRFGNEIAIIIPYATFGNNLDLSRYDRLSRQFGVPVVVDAAASLGSLDEAGQGFGTGSSIPIVYSMHVTKTFSTAEGGLIYSSAKETIDRLRIRGNFGFSEPRTSTMLGLNSKLPEIIALLACRRLDEFNGVVNHRSALAERYTSLLPSLVPQIQIGRRVAHQFMPFLLPRELGNSRDELISALNKRGIGAAKYFSPHLAEQTLFKTRGVRGNLPVTEDISRRVISLPIHDMMTFGEVETVSRMLSEEIGRISLSL